MSIRGSCLCGTVQYEVTAPFQFAGNCHCGNCRKANGAAYVSWGILQPGQFRWLAGEESIQHYQSSAGTSRCFCAKCGSPLAAAHGGAIGEVVLGSIDGDPGVRPGEHIFVGSRAPWHDITDSLPQHEAWPPGPGP